VLSAADRNVAFAVESPQVVVMRDAHDRAEASQVFVSMVTARSSAARAARWHNP
jgi:hypothetical protein